MTEPIKYHEGAFPPKILNWELLFPLIGPANAAVARYDGALSAIPNTSVLLSPLTTQEAVLSSRIEGTQATIGEVLEYEAKGKSDHKDINKEADIHEILNYRHALQSAVESMKKLPLCLRIIKDAHRILLSNVRGYNKSPGEFRAVPNWIGPHGCTVENAKYIPVSAEKLPHAMAAWEKYIHEDAADKLIQLSILHAEFEALHPFLDGNGRIGRMFVPLFMLHMGLIHAPMFFISGYLETNRDEYYERLLAVSRDGDWTGWCIFFLKTLQFQAEENLKKTQAILDLYNNLKPKIIELTHSQYAVPALDAIFDRPILSKSNFIQSSEIPKPTASRIVSVLKKEGILKELQPATGRKPAVLIFKDLLNIAEWHSAISI